MHRTVILLICFVGTTFLSISQLSSNAQKLIGTWKYSGGSGYEVWGQKGEELSGYAYRISKIGDTSKVEDMSLKRLNKRLIYSLTTYQQIKDSSATLQNIFIGGKRKMNFLNLESNTPYSIAYVFGFLNRNKLKIKIQYGLADKPVILTLFRVKD